MRILNITRDICMHFYSNAALFSHVRDDTGFRKKKKSKNKDSYEAKRYADRLVVAKN